MMRVVDLLHNEWVNRGYASALGGTISFLVGTVTSNTSGGAGIAALIGATLTALIVSSPKFIAARSAARASDHNIERANMQAMFEREQKAHSEATESLRTTISKQDRERALMRHSKHLIVGELNNAALHIQILEHICKEHDLEYEPYKIPNMATLFAHEDAGMIQLTEIKKEDTKQ